MRNKSIMLMSIMACIMMVVPTVASANSVQNNTVVSYTYKGMTVDFGNQTAEVFANGQSYTTSWMIDKVVNNTQIQEKFSSYDLDRIYNSYQNSYAFLLKNKDIQVAEIYSFANGAIDASIAVKNLLMTNTTYMATFVTVMNHHQHVITTGISENNINLPLSSQQKVIAISSQESQFNDHYISMSWESEISIFHAGLLVSTESHNVLSLPFGPFVLVNNESYSIDPKIRPDIIPIPPGGGGGGGGSGGSSPPSASFISSVSVVNNYPYVFENGSQNFTIQYDLTSLGSYSSAKIGIFAATANSETTNAQLVKSFTVYSTGTADTSFTFNEIGQFYDFVAAVWYPYYSVWNYDQTTGHSFTVYNNIEYPFDYPNSVYNGPGNPNIYDPSNGQTIVGKIYGNFWDSAPLNIGGANSKYDLSTGIAPINNSFQVNKVGIYFNYLGNTLGQTPYSLSHGLTGDGTQQLHQYVYNSSYQSYLHTTNYSSYWPKIASVLYVAAFAAASVLSDGTTAAALFAVGGALDPFLFMSVPAPNVPSNIPMNISYAQDAGSAGGGTVPSSWLALGIHHWSGDVPYFQPSLLYQVKINGIWQNPTGGAATPYVVDYMLYTMSYSIFDANDNLQIGSGMPPLYTGSYSVYVFLPEDVG